MFATVMQLLAGLGALMVGFKLLSENTAKLANGGLRSMFNKTSKNPLIGVAIGAGATMIIQSSGATTVMIVGFVNSGVMNLYQAAAMIMGANIGTTITGQIAALKSLPIAEVAMAFTLLGIAMDMFCKKDKVKTTGMLFAGLGLIFIGLELMSSSMDVFAKNEAITVLLQKINNPLLLVLIGVVSTAVVQSSSAITSILITMASSGFIIGGGGNAILFVILGTNIGSCVTALLSSVSANTNGKRAAIIHVLFNVFGSLLFMILLLCWKDFMSVTFGRWFGDAGTQVAMFHTFFNVICTILFVPFIKIFVWLATKIFKDKKDEKEHQSHLDIRVLRSPAVALACTDAEIEDACALAMQTVDMSLNNFIDGKTETDNDIRAKIDKVNEMGRAITEYLVKVSSGEISYADEQKVGRLHYVIADVVRVAELADNIIHHTERSVREQMVFSDQVKEQLTQMNKDIFALYENAMRVFVHNEFGLIPMVDSIEQRIDDTRKSLIQGHIDRLGEGKCQPKSSGVFINLVGNLERIADHLNSIAHSNLQEKLQTV